MDQNTNLGTVGLYEGPQQEWPRQAVFPAGVGGSSRERQAVCSAPAALPAPGRHRHRFLPPALCRVRTALCRLDGVHARVRVPSSLIPTSLTSLGSLIAEHRQPWTCSSWQEGDDACRALGDVPTHIHTAERCPCLAASWVDFAEAWPGGIPQVLTLACASRRWQWSSIPSRGREGAQTPFAEVPPQHGNGIPSFCNASSFPHTRPGVGRLCHMLDRFLQFLGWEIHLLLRPAPRQEWCNGWQLQGWRLPALPCRIRDDFPTPAGFGASLPNMCLAWEVPSRNKQGSQELLVQFACPCPTETLCSPKPPDPPVTSTCA
ncbi:uncharacterized protein LOC134555196 [Prinia subflava]|uniref:uncharacterized protein LOC134555196 n=1 Tax=Prinia subflava TaxID=208062 RepID=UPI002FDFBFE1